MDNYHKTGDQKIPTRMFCHICGHLHKIDFWVPDEIWNEAIHPKWRDTHVCINCFMERADERLLEWEKDIILIPCSMATQLKVQQGEEVPDGISAINEVNGLRKKVEELELIIYGIEEGAAKWESLCADKDKEIAELKRHKDQNDRMRIWFEERTGLKEELLSIHMESIDQQITDLKA